MDAPDEATLAAVDRAPAMSMKDLAAITLAPKMIAKLKAEVKAIKEKIGGNSGESAT